ncbi:MAG: recombinase family protein [Acidimicrobiales bacterium]
MRDKQDKHAAQGRPAGGVTFGYRHTIDPATRRKALVVVPEQAELIREAASRVLAGESLAGIAKDFARRGHVGARGGELGAASVKSWVTSPTIAGRRKHRGQIVGSSDWEPIVPEDMWRACCAK